MEALVSSLTWFQLCQPSSSQVTFGHASGNSIFLGLFGYDLSAWQKTRGKRLVVTFGTWLCLLVQKHSLCPDLVSSEPRQHMVFISLLACVLSLSSSDYFTQTQPTSNGKSTNPSVGFLNMLGKN